MELEQIRAAMRRLPADQLRHLLAEFVPGDGTAKDLAEIQYSLAADRQEFLNQLAQLSAQGDEPGSALE